MIRLFLNDLTNNIIGYEYMLSGYEAYKNDILVEETAENIALLKSGVIEHNLYYSDGKLTVGEADSYSASLVSKARDIKSLEDTVNNEHQKIVDSLIGGKTMDEAVAEAQANRLALESAKTDLENTIAQHERELFTHHAATHSSAEQNKEWKYYSSVCLLIRDENRYLEEWLNWHLGIVDHIYIYDNGISESVSDIVSTLPEASQNKITVVRWAGNFSSVQEEAYNHFLKHYGRETRWANFIDSDEFIRLVNADETLNEALERLEDYTVVYTGFVEYNANGKIEYEDAPVRERFTQTVDVNAGLLHKDFFQPFRVDKIHRHYPRFSARGNYTYSNENKNSDIFVIDHYYTKSWEEWCQKIERGSCDPNFLKRKSEFFVYNPEMKNLVSDDDSAAEAQSYNA